MHGRDARIPGSRELPEGDLPSGGKDGKPAPISRVAERLAVAPASVTEMVQRLARDGLVKHVRYGGVSLTARGTAGGPTGRTPPSPRGDVSGQ